MIGGKIKKGVIGLMKKINNLYLNKKFFITDILRVHIHDNDGKSDLHITIREGVIDFYSSV